MEKLTVYEGEKPYIFLSYAHANAPAVRQIAEELSAQGYRIWYDEGVEVGSEWPEYIASHLAGAGLMIAFLSNAYMRSDNCRKETHFALTRRIPVVNVFLEETAMTPGMEMQTGNLFALMKYRMGEDEFYDKLLAAPQLDASLREGGHVPRKRRRRKKAVVDLGVEARRRKKRKLRALIAALLVLALLVAALVLGLVGWSTGLLPRLLIRRALPEPVPPDGAEIAVFSCGALEDAARAACGRDEGEIRVSELAALCELSLSGEEIDAAALAELRYFPNLHTLVLEDAPLADLEALPLCPIEQLTLRRCALSSLSGVGDLPYLRELRAEDCPLRSLGDLGRCLDLRLLSLRGGFVRDLSSLRPLTRLTEVELGGLTLQELRPILRMSALSSLALTDCDLRGRFFRSFDREGALVSLSLTDCKLSSTRGLDEFEGLTTLTLLRSGEALDFSALSGLPALRTVRADPDTAGALRAALAGSGVSLEITEE